MMKMILIKIIVIMITMVYLAISVPVGAKVASADHFPAKIESASTLTFRK
jgi:hypothetical protein